MGMLWIMLPVIWGAGASFCWAIFHVGARKDNRRHDVG